VKGRQEMSKKLSAISVRQERGQDIPGEVLYRQKLERDIERNIGPYAYHEAGHAVLAHNLSLGVRAVRIGPTVNRDDGWDSVGKTEYNTKIDELCDEGRRAMAEDMVVATMAGPIAESHYRRTRVAWHCIVGSDRNVIHRLTLFHCRGCNSSKCLKAYEVYLRTRSEEWVEDLWPQIEVIAAALIEQRSLTGDQVADTLRRLGSLS